MHSIGKYLFAVISISLFLSICKTFIPEKGLLGSVFKLICGILLSMVLITPVKNVEFGDFQVFYNKIQNDAAYLTNNGEEYAKDALSNSIDASITSYILDKASALDLKLNIQLLLSDDSFPQPCGLIIKGNASPFAKKQLKEVICNDLGIHEENIEWD